ncbi:MAG: hypothetical protein HWD92_04780 [Flavobacteriia bacterium]|nr:hypothetical protein [Flavobacteriia bacterium]
MRLLTTFAFIITTLAMSAQGQLDIRILNLVNDDESISMDYEEVSFETSAFEDLKSGYASPPTLALPKNLIVYIYHPRLGLIRTHIRDLMRQGPSMWRDKYFRVHLDGTQVVKLEEIVILD